MNETLQKYEYYLQTEELAEGSRCIYIREAKRFMEFAGDREITKKMVTEYKTVKNNSNLKAATINLHLVAVNKFLVYLGKESSRVKVNRIQKNHSVNNVISKDEYKELCDYALKSGREKYYHIMRVLAGTGIRVSELRYFTIDSIQSGVICVHNKGKNREIYVPEEIIRELKAYGMKENISAGPVFTGNTGKPISRNAVFKMLKYLADMIGVSKEKVYPHSFRHLFALTYMEKYHNLSELADILGHSSLETTRIYLSNSAEQKQAKMGKLGLL